jgi:hypothetical protein
MRITLDLAEVEPEIAYAGQIEAEGGSFPLRARVAEREGSPDGLAAVAEIEGYDEARRAELERIVATMVRSAVRGSRKDGRPAPRRIQRWRSLL